jgi:hypothetical protein
MCHGPATRNQRDGRRGERSGCTKNGRQPRTAYEVGRATTARGSPQFGRRLARPTVRRRAASGRSAEEWPRSCTTAAKRRARSRERNAPLQSRNPGPRRRGRACSRAQSRLSARPRRAPVRAEPPSAYPVLGCGGFDNEVHQAAAPDQRSVFLAQDREIAERESARLALRRIAPDDLPRRRTRSAGGAWRMALDRAWRAA